MDYKKHDIERPATVEALVRWLEKSPKRAWCLYWEGFLPIDQREEAQGVARGAQFSHYPAHVVRGLARNAYEARTVVLCQARVGRRHFRYFMVKA